AGIIGVLTVAVVTERRSSRPPRGVPTAAPQSREVVTAAAQRASMELGDGTRVTLMPGSRFRIAERFGDTTIHRREVYLDGEASFAVRHDGARPFIVHTPHGSVEDLGTEFVVNTYPETRGMRLAVREGQVAIHARSIGAEAGNSIAQSTTVAVL